jgi:Raf kinase inhibitor-like YbhB/YbcL family protein
VAPRRAWRRSIALGCCQIALLTLGCGGHSTAPAPPPAAARIDLAGLPATIPARYTCSGAGERPPLRWSGVPRGSAELVLVVTDPDAPGGRFVHWTAYGIAPGARAVPARVREGANSAGGNGWTPPCPPGGDEPHRYVFDLYALRAPSGLKQGADADAVIAAVRGAAARGELVARFGR